MSKTKVETVYTPEQIAALMKEVVAGIEPEAEDSEEFSRGFREGMQALQSGLSAAMEVDASKR